MATGTICKTKRLQNKKQKQNKRFLNLKIDIEYTFLSLDESQKCTILKCVENYLYDHLLYITRFTQRL